MLAMRIKPLVYNRIRVPDSELAFSAACFSGTHWTLSKLREPEDAIRNADFADEVGCALKGIGVKRAYAPNPTAFNGAIIEPRELMFPIVLPYGVIMYRNGTRPADSTFLRAAGDAGVFSAGGCGMVVLAYREVLMFAHAGRESLLDRTEIKTRGRQRSRKSDLVDNMLDALGVSKQSMHLVRAWPLYFIRPEDFLHSYTDPDPAHAEYNRAAGEYLPEVYDEACGVVDTRGIYIDLPGIAKVQFMRRGVPEENIHLEHSDLSKELPTTRNGGGRYLVVAVREYC